MVYVLADDMLWRRDVLTQLGAQDPARLDTILQGPSAPRRRGDVGAREARAHEIAAFAAAMGGEAVAS